MAFGWNTYLKPAARKIASFIFANFWQSAMAFFLFVFLVFWQIFINIKDLAFIVYAALFSFAIAALFFAYFGYNCVKNQKKGVAGCIAAGFIISLISCIVSNSAIMLLANINTKAAPSNANTVFPVVTFFSSVILVVFSTLFASVGAVYASMGSVRTALKKGLEVVRAPQNEPTKPPISQFLMPSWKKAKASLAIGCIVALLWVMGWAVIGFTAYSNYFPLSSIGYMILSLPAFLYVLPVLAPILYLLVCLAAHFRPRLLDFIK